MPVVRVIANAPASAAAYSVNSTAELEDVKRVS
jgi:hypothetical protein